MEETVDRAETAVRAPAKPVIDKARAVAGWGGGSPRARDHSPSDRPGTGESGKAGREAPLASARKSTRTEHGPSPSGSVTGRTAPFVDTAGSPRASLPSHTSRPAASTDRLGSGPRPAVTQWSSPLPGLDPPSASNPEPVSSPSPSGPLVTTSSSGALSSTSVSSAWAAALIAVLSVAAASLVGRLRLPPALLRPVAFVSLLERPG